MANAVGAAFCQVSGSVDKMVELTKPREELLESFKQEAISIAISKGANPQTIHVLEISEIELPYIDVPSIRIKVKVVGDLDDKENNDGIDVDGRTKKVKK